VLPRGAGRRLVAAAVLLTYGAIATVTVRNLNLRFDFSSWRRRDLPLLSLERARNLEGTPDGQLFSQIRSVTSYLQKHLPPREPLFTFPALTLLNFLSDRPSAVPHDYFFARLPHRGEAEIVDTLQRMRPPLIVVTNMPGTFFIDAAVYYFLLRNYIREHYVHTQRVGMFDLLHRRDRSERVGWAADVPQDHVGILQLEQRLHAKIMRPGQDSQPREQVSSLPKDTVRKLLRGLQGNLRATSLNNERSIPLIHVLGEWAVPYLLETYAVSDAGMRKEIALILNVIFLQEMHTRYRLAGAPFPLPLEDGDLPPAVLDLVSRSELPWRERAAIARILGLIAVEGAIPQLKEAARDERVRPSVLLALAEIGETMAACQLVAALGRSDWLAEVYFPNTLLSAASTQPEVEACLADAVRHLTGRRREIAAWIAGAVGTPTLRAALAEALADTDPAAQTAARWFLDRHHGAGG
jgi:hypothetical protein